MFSGQVTLLRCQTSVYNSLTLLCKTSHSEEIIRIPQLRITSRLHEPEWFTPYPTIRWINCHLPPSELWSSGRSQSMRPGPIQPCCPNYEINDVNPGVKHVSKIQRFMLFFKIQPIPVREEKKINCRACFVLRKNQSSFLPMIPLLSGCWGPSFTPPSACWHQLRQAAFP